MINFTKLLLHMSIGLIFLTISLYIGGIRLYNGSENLVVIYKYPSLQKIYIYRCPHEGDEGNKHSSNFFINNIRKVVEVRELSKLQDIQVLFYILLLGGIIFFSKALVIIKRIIFRQANKAKHEQEGPHDQTRLPPG